MNKKLKKIVASISLVFMGLFVVSLVIACIDFNLLNGAIGYVALFTGFIGISLYIVLYLDNKAAKRNEEAAKRHDLTDAEPSPEKMTKDETKEVEAQDSEASDAELERKEPDAEEHTP